MIVNQYNIQKEKSSSVLFSSSISPAHFEPLSSEREPKPGFSVKTCHLESKTAAEQK